MAKPSKKNKKNKPSKRIKITGFLFAIVVLTIIVFSNVSHNQFISNWDDNLYILKNNYIHSLSFENIKNIFTVFDVGNYHPVTILTYAIEYKLFGLNPKPFHVTNLIFHLFNILLVFGFIHLLTKKLNVSVIVALFFAVHPMHVESVSWVSERKDVLYTFFYLGGLISYLYYLKDLNKQRYLYYTFCLFVLSLLSKSAAVTFPVILVLIDYYTTRVFKRRVVIEKVPFFLFSILFGVIAIFSQQSGEAIQDLFSTFTLFDRFFIICYAVMFYIVKLFAPINLCAVYYYPDKINGALPVEYYLAPLAIIIIIWGVYKAYSYKKELIFGLLFFLISVSLVLQIIPIGQAVAADRYTYMPYIGLFFIIGQFYSRLTENKIKNAKNIKTAVLTGIVIYTLFFSVAAFNRNKVWKDGIALFTDVIEKYPHVGHGYTSRACARTDNQDYQGAIEDFDKGISIKPDYAIEFNNRGNAKFKLHDYKGAIEDYDKTLEIDSTYAMAYFNRATAIENLYQDYRKAINDYTKAIKLQPQYTLAYNSRGLAKYNLQDYRGALEDCSKSVEISPDFPFGYHNRGLAKFGLKDYQGAIKDYTKAIELKPNYAKAYYNRGVANYYIRDMQGACNDWQSAVKYGDDNAKAMIEGYCK